MIEKASNFANSSIQFDRVKSKGLLVKEKNYQASDGKRLRAIVEGSEYCPLRSAQDRRLNNPLKDTRATSRRSCTHCPADV